MVLSFELRFPVDEHFCSSLVGWFEFLRSVDSLTTEQIFLCSLVYSSKIGISLDASFADVIRILKECNFNLNELNSNFK